MASFSEAALGQKSRRCRINPACTLSQNAYGGGFSKFAKSSAKVDRLGDVTRYLA
jgi:hypothetical protein